MPLFETIIIGRCSDSKGSANLLRQVAVTVMKKGGNVREMKLLGDRILSKYIRGNDGKKHIIGRYYQVIYDANQETKNLAENKIKDSYETLRLRTHLLKDFYNEAQLYKKTMDEQSPFIEEQIRKRHYIEELAKIVAEQESKTKNSEKKAE